MRFVMGNQNTVLLEASCTGNLRKVQQALDRASASDVNRKGQVKLTCILPSGAGHLKVFFATALHLPVLSYSIWKHPTQYYLSCHTLLSVFVLYSLIK